MVTGLRGRQAELEERIPVRPTERSVQHLVLVEQVVQAARTEVVAGVGAEADPAFPQDARMSVMRQVAQVAPGWDVLVGAPTVGSG
jgi:hypothetical protein